jgi:hypothetical protein
VPFKFDHPVLTKEGAGKLQATIEPDKKKITANFKSNNFGIQPDISSNSYSIN